MPTACDDGDARCLALRRCVAKGLALGLTCRKPRIDEALCGAHATQAADASLEPIGSVRIRRSAHASSNCSASAARRWQLDDDDGRPPGTSNRLWRHGCSLLFRHPRACSSMTTTSGPDITATKTATGPRSNVDGARPVATGGPAVLERHGRGLLSGTLEHARQDTKMAAAATMPATSRAMQRGRRPLDGVGERGVGPRQHCARAARTHCCLRHPRACPSMTTKTTTGRDTRSEDSFWAAQCNVDGARSVSEAWSTGTLTTHIFRAATSPSTAHLSIRGTAACKASLAAAHRAYGRPWLARPAAARIGALASSMPRSVGALCTLSVIPLLHSSGRACYAQRRCG